MLSDGGRFSTFMETDILTFESGSCSKGSEIDIDKSIIQEMLQDVYREACELV